MTNRSYRQEAKRNAVEVIEKLLSQVVEKIIKYGQVPSVLKPSNFDLLVLLSTWDTIHPADRYDHRRYALGDDDLSEFTDERGPRFTYSNAVWHFAEEFLRAINQACEVKFSGVTPATKHGCFLVERLIGNWQC